MVKRPSRLVTVLYDPEKRQILGRGGRFMPLDEFSKYPPEQQEDIVPHSGAPSADDPDDVDPDPGPQVKCINGMEHWCYLNRCYPTGKSC